MAPKDEKIASWRRGGEKWVRVRVGGGVRAFLLIFFKKNLSEIFVRHVLLANPSGKTEISEISEISNRNFKHWYTGCIRVEDDMDNLN